MLKTIAGREMRKLKRGMISPMYKYPPPPPPPPPSPVPLSFRSCSSKQRFNIPRLAIASARLWTRWGGDNSTHQFVHLRVTNEDLQNFSQGQ